MKKINIIIPCYNEEDSLAKLFSELLKLEELLKGKYEVRFTFVDDGSKDKTLHLLNENISKLQIASVLKHEVNKNLGGALKTGTASITDEDYVAYLDSDCTYKPEIIVSLLEAVENGADIATVSPYHPKGKVEGVPAWRLLLSKGISLIYQILLWKKMYTFTAMVRVYRTEKLRELNSDRNDFGFVAELMISALKKRFNVVEVPATLAQREFGVSKMRLLNTIKAHLEIVWKILKGSKF